MRRAGAALALLALAALVPGAAPAGGGTVHHVAIEGFAFQPQVLLAQAGDTVRWTNRDAAPHTVVAYLGGWNSPEELFEGDSWERAFAEPGAHPYFCGVHPGMRAYLVVAAAAPREA